jgi:RNA polymerase sigma factor (sigma-70 family)
MEAKAAEWQATRVQGRPVKAKAMPDGFERLFLAEYARVVAIARRVLQDGAEAEDVAQEVFLDFHRKHSALADYAPAWLHRAAFHTALNQLRGRRRRQQREHASYQADEPVPDAESAALASEERRLVRGAMQRLPRRSAAVLALRYGGLSYEQIAAALGVKVGQVGTLLRRAEARLRKEVQG